jgi:ectoine hydroxylase-related dioxygenase (phytanoyl-CoA dioxygenase family)
MKPPHKPELMFEDIWANKAGVAVLENVMGPNPVCVFVDSNTSLGEGFGGRQSVHADMAYNFPTFPCSVSFNYYLEDASSANGSTEVWLGSALESSFKDHKACREMREGDDPVMPRVVNLRDPDDRNVLEGFGVREAQLEARRKWAPPIQPSIKKGSVMLRDLRTWHAGVANPSRKPRVMLNFIYTPWWHKCPNKAHLPENARPLVEAWASREVAPVRYNAEYLPDEQAIKDLDYSTDFSSRNVSYWKSLPQGLIPGYVFSSL